LHHRPLDLDQSLPAELLVATATAIVMPNVKPSSARGSPGVQVMIVAPPPMGKDRRSKVARGCRGPLRARTAR
jgi:hypothetical protein